jgi:hypothetical protein
MEIAWTDGIVRFDVSPLSQFNAHRSRVEAQRLTRIRSKLKQQEATKRQSPSMQNAQS